MVLLCRRRRSATSVPPPTPTRYRLADGKFEFSTKNYLSTLRLTFATSQFVDIIRCGPHRSATSGTSAPLPIPTRHRRTDIIFEFYAKNWSKLPFLRRCIRFSAQECTVVREHENIAKNAPEREPEPEYSGEIAPFRCQIRNRRHQLPL